MTISMYALIGLVIGMLGLWLGHRLGLRHADSHIDRLKHDLKWSRASNEQHQYINGILRRENAELSELVTKYQYDSQVWRGMYAEESKR